MADFCWLDLRPGGAIEREAPCASGYLIMGLIAPAIGQNETGRLSSDQRARAERLADTIKVFSRRDPHRNAPRGTGIMAYL